MKKLAGTWEGYAVEGRGERPDRGPVHLQLIINGDKISAVDLGSPDKNKDMGSGAYKLDPSQELKHIDATGVVLPGKRGLSAPTARRRHARRCVDNRMSDPPIP
jgi:hypothetical protein